MSLADEPSVRQLIELARREDLGPGDMTSGLLANPAQPGVFRIMAKAPGVLAGQEIGQAVLAAYDESIELTWNDALRDGDAFEAVPQELARIHGPVGAVLSAERVLLNFLQRLCGVATQTRRFVDAVRGTSCAIYDTRKTTPGWRVLEKYAVRCGGGHNHRMGLFDAVLIKDNHLAGVETGRIGGAVFEMLNRLDAAGHRAAFIEAEAQSVAHVEEILKVIGVDVVLLDNFSQGELRSAVALRDGLGLRGKVILEASGGITLDNVRAVAETGVDRISIGALTHSAAAVDLSCCLDTITRDGS